MEDKIEVEIVKQNNGIVSLYFCYNVPMGHEGIYQVEMKTSDLLKAIDQFYFKDDEKI